MKTLLPGEYELFLDCIRELHSFRDAAALRAWLLETALPKLVPSDWLSYNEVDLANPANTIAILKPDSPERFQKLFPRFQELMHQHPLVVRQLHSDNFPVHKISDFLKQDEYRRLELYRDVYRHLGVEYQIAATIKLEPDRITAIALSRQKEDYTERDRAMLELLRPHLVIAFNHLALAAERQHLLDTVHLALHEFSSATAIVNLQGRILYHVGPGLQWLGAARSEFLPDAIQNWLQETTPALRRSFRLDSTAGEVHIRAVPTPSRDRILLVLTLHDSGPSETDGNAFGLTRREDEVAHWICRGKSNAEIAAILGISPRTVHKHVEHILARAGVESRVALTVRLLEHRPPRLN